MTLVSLVICKTRSRIIHTEEEGKESHQRKEEATDRFETKTTEESLPQEYRRS